jgi:pimeloyl-ACP methyl ester carboxylesterase
MTRNPLQPREICADLQGRKLYGWLSGSGIPTVILDSGLGDSSEAWSKVQPQVTQFTSVLCYDRAGLGRSHPASTPRTCQDMVADLRTLLAAASLPPPYVLVAHSWSGLNARCYANHYPAEIAGMVLIDSVHEGKYERFAQVLSDERAQRMWASIEDPAKNDECIDRMASIAQVTASQRLYDFPLIVLTRASDGDPLSQIEIDLQAEFLNFSPTSRQYFSSYADHFIHTSEPELVIDAIHQLVEMARAG